MWLELLATFPGRAAMLSPYAPFRVPQDFGKGKPATDCSAAGNTCEHHESKTITRCAIRSGNRDTPGTGPRVGARVESDATHAVRAEIERDGHVRLNINSACAYPDLAWGNECPAIPASSVYEGSVRLRLTENDSINADFKDR